MFVLKTLKESEKKLLLSQGILENYYKHVMSSKRTFLSRFYGVFLIRVQYMQEITCFIMDNLLGQDFMHIERIYDLKGSKKGRVVKLTQEEEQNKSGLKVLKDLNFLSVKEHLEISKGDKERILEVVFNDTLFLRRNRLMDYSLLFIKSRNPQHQPEHPPFQRMPALVYVKQKDGNNRLQL